MDITEVIQKKLELEEAITKSLSSLINNFRKETGTSPTGIYITLITDTVIGDIVEKRIMGEATVDIQL